MRKNGSSINLVVVPFYWQSIMSRAKVLKYINKVFFCNILDDDLCMDLVGRVPPINIYASVNRKDFGFRVGITSCQLSRRINPNLGPIMTAVSAEFEKG